MPIPRVVRDIQETLDEHSHNMKNSAYCDLCKKMVGLTNALDNDADQMKRMFSMDLLLELPACGGAPSVAKYTHDRAFMQEVMQRKAGDLKEYDKHCAAVMGTAWKIELTEALMPYDDASMLPDVRIGVQNLLMSRAGFLPQIVNRLTRLGISPEMLCPLDLGKEPEEGDDGCGPTAEDFLYHEPRFLRWILGRGALEPWPTLFIGDQPEHVSKLILVANSEGGDNEKVNQPCQCLRCRGTRIPTVEGLRATLAPSECGSGSEDEMVL
jgi:hypothetical protein